MNVGCYSGSFHFRDIVGEYSVNRGIRAENKRFSKSGILRCF